MALWKKNLILSIIVIVLAVLPLITLKNAEFAGADGLAETAITEILIMSLGFHHFMSLQVVK